MSEANNTTESPAADGDQSMEEILQSIRKIIAEEDEVPAKGSESEKVMQETDSGEEDIQGSDVLELTEMEEVDEEPAAEETPAEPEAQEATEEASEEALDNLDEALFGAEAEDVAVGEESAEEAEVEAEAASEDDVEAIMAGAMDEEPVAEETLAEPEEVQAEQPAAEEPQEEKVLDASEIEALMADSDEEVPASANELLSDVVAKESAAAIQVLKHKADEHLDPVDSGPITRGGVSTEDLVLEALRPMLKEWLDKNLATIVKKLVEKEIKRITSGS